MGPGWPPHPVGSPVDGTVASKNTALYPAATSVATAGLMPALWPASCGPIVQKKGILGVPYAAASFFTKATYSADHA